MQNRLPHLFSESQEETWPDKAASIAPILQAELQKRFHQVVTLVKEHPAKGVGVAVGLGVLMGWFMKRR